MMVMLWRDEAKKKTKHDSDRETDGNTFIFMYMYVLLRDAMRIYRRVCVSHPLALLLCGFSWGLRRPSLSQSTISILYYSYI